MILYVYVCFFGTLKRPWDIELAVSDPLRYFLLFEMRVSKRGELEHTQCVQTKTSSATVATPFSTQKPLPHTHPRPYNLPTRSVCPTGIFAQNKGSSNQEP